MNNRSIFVSHATADDAFVKELRTALERLHLSVWVDSRNLRGGAKLAPEIAQAIEQARQVIVVLSPNTINSPWVRKEIAQALQVEQRRKDDGYRVIPLLLPGVEPAALALWFDEEPMGVRVQLATGALSEALPRILAALGERLPDDFQPFKAIEPQPVEELVLELRDVEIHLNEKGERRVQGNAELRYQPAAAGAREVVSRRYAFRAPLGPIEAEDLRWYLESYYVWPVGVFAERAKWIESQLPQWGQQLYAAALKAESAQEPLRAWQATAKGAERRFSVMVDSEPPEGASDEQRAAANAAASALLGLPWELLHDGRGYLFQGKSAARVRRRLPNYHALPLATSALPIRVLLASPRPEDDRAGYIDHRASAQPLVEAVENLGELIELTVLEPPTLPALQEALGRAAEAGQPFDVVHFDGHGVYDSEHGLGALCFEDPKDADKLQKRASLLVDAAKLAELIRDHRIPLVFLEACESAKVEDDPTASVAAKLLEEGVTSVVAMSHSVLVETARRFVQAFYAELARGSRAGKAMLAGQQALYNDSYRGKIMGAGELRLQDWFVPVLYQEANDPQLIDKLPPREVQQIEAQSRQRSFGGLPPTPAHHFQGRSRELLALERLLHREQYAVVRGQGGAGKTTLAAELARWLVRSGRFERAAFVSVEQIGDARAVLDSLGRQLLPEGQNFSVAQYKDMDEALQPVARALRDEPTLIVLDNLESVLPGPGTQSAAAAPVEQLFDLAEKLLAADPRTRVLFTSRESLPAPFANRRCEIELGSLSRADAIELVSRVMAQEGWTPPQSDAGQDPQEVVDLVEAVNRHARALVLLAREVAQRGVRATTENLRALMAELERKYPGERENSLYASVELSLRRLPAEVREKIKGLGVFHGGGHIVNIAKVLEVEVDAAQKFATTLIDVGLAEDMGYGHLRLDPALPPYLLSQMSAEEQEAARVRWAEGMEQLTNFLVQQRNKDTKLAAQLTLVELQNLQALMDWADHKVSPEHIVNLTTMVEYLLAPLGRPQALARIMHARENAARALGKWSRARYEAESQRIDRLREQGELQRAYYAAEQLLEQSLNAGESVYPAAAYNIARAYFKLGRVLREIGAAEAALEPLAEARRRFQVLWDAGDASAERMASIAIVDTGDCLLDLGRVDEAAIAYEESIKRATQLDDKRQIAVNKAQLGGVRLLQRRYGEALRIYTEARDTFARLGEPRMVAIAWHQIGMAYRWAGQLDEAERAYQQALAISVQQQDIVGQADTLTELGNLYIAMGHLEQAVTFFRQAADVYVTLDNLIGEGRVLNNLANTLIKLGRYNDARRELQRAMNRMQPYGHAAEPWKMWNVLHDLEQAHGNQQAATAARRQAIASFLAYRRDGGENQNPGAKLAALVLEAIQSRDATEAEQTLARCISPDAKPWAKALIPKLQAVLGGARDPALADDPALEYDDAAEVLLLLERLNRE